MTIAQVVARPTFTLSVIAIVKPKKMQTLKVRLRNVAAFAPVPCSVERTDEEGAPGAEGRGMATLSLRHAMGRKNTRFYCAQLGAAARNQALSSLSSCCRTPVTSLLLCTMTGFRSAATMTCEQQNTTCPG